MTVLNKFSGYESREYEIELGAWALPRELIVPEATFGDRNLVLVPDQSLVDQYPVFRKFGFSNILGARFAYIPRDGLRLNLDELSSRVGSIHKTVLRLAVVKWVKQSTEEFPPELLCLAELCGPGGIPLQRTMEVNTAIGRRSKE